MTDSVVATIEVDVTFGLCGSQRTQYPLIQQDTLKLDIKAPIV